MSPGVSVIVLSEKAVERVNGNNVKSMYFDLKDALKMRNAGQTPFTPAVGILATDKHETQEIDAAGGEQSEIDKIHGIAIDFRNRI